MKRSTFLKSLIAAPAAIAVAAKTEAQPSLPLGAKCPVTGKFMTLDEIDKSMGLDHEHDLNKLKAKGGYLVPPEWADELEVAMRKYPG